MNTLALGPSWLDPDYLLNTFGLPGLLLIVFAESGLLIGFFLPGDSLLFTTGLLVTTGDLKYPLWLVCTLVAVAAIVGDQVGYLFGRKVGPSLFKRPDSRLFKQENVEKAHEFFEKYGPKSLVLARFVPIVRTFTPIIAGVSRMNYRSFITFNIIGGVLWGVGVTLLGAALGKIDFVHEHIELILILIVLISVVPIVIEFLRARSRAKKEAATGEQRETQSPAEGGPSDPAQGFGTGDGLDAGRYDPGAYGTAGGTGAYEGGPGAFGDTGPDPYGTGRPTPYNGTQPDPYGNAQPDPYGNAQPDPYGNAQSDPYNNAQAGPYGSGQAVPYGGPYGNAQPGPYGDGGPDPYGSAQYGQAPQGPYGNAQQGAYGNGPYGAAQPGAYDGSRPGNGQPGPYDGPRPGNAQPGPYGNAQPGPYGNGQPAPYDGGYDTGRYGDRPEDGQEGDPGQYGWEARR
ncbi:VTT domain-containing protein [Streptomyces sp. NBC_01754]|uniref:VTT domain-containing protein n=1 Tax=Streptomyces sp. NBC_01754 TaxID=2975930 RepID=UPI002DDBA2FF|nr:VTT domain-containing protein [Streptomyces sp. NBC_01754]WSC93186.1 VTT domain-containing protein [Streptomyces sp. NBC_01754]